MSKELQKLKCGGKKKKKFQGGGFNLNNPISIGNMPGGSVSDAFSSYIGSQSTGSSVPTEPQTGQALSGKLGIIKAATDAVLRTKNLIAESFMPDETDIRDNPLKDMRIRDSINTAKSITLNPGTWFAAIKGAGERKQARLNAVSDWSNDWNAKYAAGARSQAYKSGGHKLSANKAQKILDDGKVHGRVLTTKQKKLFRAVAHGMKLRADGGPVGKPDYTGMGIGFMNKTPAERRSISINHMKNALIPLDPDTPKYITGVPPITGIVGKVGQVASAYKKLNYFRPNPEMYYRGIGKSGAMDAAKSRVFRANPNPETVTIKTGSGLRDITKNFSKTYFTPNFKTAEKYGKGYVAEVPKDATTFVRRYPNKDWSQIAKEEIPIEKGRILKKDFLSGYKEVNVPKYNNGGVMLRTGIKVKQQSFAKGGKIEGPGGPKSDSIEKNIEDGSFIVPAENATKALRLGKQYLGWEDDEQASRTYPGTEVLVSDGEVLFTPEEVNVLSYNGIDVNKLAPNAGKNRKMATGGWKYDDQDGNYYWNTDVQGDDPGAAEWLAEQNALKLEGQGQPATQETVANTDTKKGTTEPEKGFLSKSLEYIPEIAGLIQTGAAVNGIRKAGAMPDVNVSSMLNRAVVEARKEAETGLRPSAKNAMLNEAEVARRDATNALVNRGGSSGELMANLQGILKTTIGEKHKTELYDINELARKQSRADNLLLPFANQQMEVEKLNRQSWMDIQEVNAGLLSAGISNIVGARKLKAELDAQKKIAEMNRLKFTLPK